MKKSAWAALALLLCYAFSLLPAPAGASMFGPMTVRDEIELGKEFDKKLRGVVTFVDDPEVTGYVHGLVARVVATLPPQPFPFTDSVVRNSAMNAFAVPGGYIYIFTGLIVNMRTEGELASVIGHELAHVTLRHVSDRMEKMKVVGIASMLGTLAGVFLGMGGGSNAANMGNALALGSQAGAQSAYLGYTQENEREADHLGMTYLTGAGYNPKSMVGAFETMRKNKWYTGSGNFPSYLSTHPGLNERISYLSDRLKEAPAAMLARSEDDTAFLRVQTLLRARLLDPDVALAHYTNIPADKRSCTDWLGLAVSAHRSKRYDLAWPALDKALACGPDDPLFAREAGRMYFDSGLFDKAAPLLQKAVLMKPRDPVALFCLGRLLGTRREYAQALGYLETAKDIAPNDAEIRANLGRLYGEAGDLFSAHLNLAYAAISERDLKKAEFQVRRARGLAQTPEQKKAADELEELYRQRAGE